MNGWRGPITNKLEDPKWKNKVKKFKIDPTLKWNFAEIKNLDNSNIFFEDINTKEKNTIQSQKLKRALKKDINKDIKSLEKFLVKQRRNDDRE